jgi:hypothetical protein
VHIKGTLGEDIIQGFKGNFVFFWKIDVLRAEFILKLHCLFYYFFVAFRKDIIGVPEQLFIEDIHLIDLLLGHWYVAYIFE